MVERMERYLKNRSTVDAAASEDPDLSIFPSLTISRQCGTRFPNLERPLLEYLDGLDTSTTGSWALFDQSLLGRVLEIQRFQRLATPFQADNAKFPVTAALREKMGLPQKNWTLFNHSANAIRHLCLAGRALVVGRAGNFVTSDLGNTFHVRLIADKGRRVEFVSQHFQIDKTEASELVEETDKSRSRFVKRHTDGEIDNAVGYHLVLNTDQFEDEVAVRVIADSLNEWSQIRTAKLMSADAKPEHGKIVEGYFSPGQPQ